MMRNRWIVAIALTLVASGILALAGDSGHKCKLSTQDCLNHMAAKMKNSGWVGLELDMDDNTHVLTVTKVVPGSPAEAAGMQPGDVLYALNGVQINDANEEQLKQVKKDWKPGQSVNYTIKRNGEDHQVTLTLAPMPADVLARYIGQHMLEHATVDVAAK
ncbi:MAG TPA: PDZ domain-containing protein [Candidatus Polarisedimenticolia bacterium]|nr:PDZ domain-containing protein [Candidatus Polarisedimenticolia bacterium]